MTPRRSKTSSPRSRTSPPASRPGPMPGRSSLTQLDVDMLMRLLRTYLGKYRKLLIAVVLFQLVQTSASLYLPSLNAHIIDRGIAKGDNAYIHSTGFLMLSITLVQI